MKYLTAGKTVSIFTDHSNLVYIYDPVGKQPGIGRHTASKLMRWDVKLNGFRYIIEHVPGDQNVWADMLTRWAFKCNTTVNVQTIGKLKSLFLAPVNPAVDNKLDWPSQFDLEEAQSRSKSTLESTLTKNENLYHTANGKVWIPDDEKLLQLRILVAAHTNRGGQRG